MGMKKNHYKIYQRFDKITINLKQSFKQGENIADN